MTYTETRQAGDNKFTTVWASKEAKAAMEEQMGHPLAGRFVSGFETPDTEEQAK